MNRILSADNLPSLPVVAMEVLDLTEQDDASAGDIAKVIEKDPALTARVLKMVNSSLFGMAKTIASLQQATVVLGLRTVKVVALSFSLVDSMGAHEARSFDFELYWRRSLTAAVMARLIADAVDVARRDEAFVGGLLCDVGLVAACRTVPEVYAPVWRHYAAARCPIQDIERKLLGTTHAEISAALLGKWNLPDMLCAAVAAHHGEGIDAFEGRLRVVASPLYAASCIAETFCGDVPSAELEAVTQRCADATGIESSKLGELMEVLDAQLKEAAGLFCVNIGPSAPYQELRDRAVAQLAAISVSAEQEREKASNQAEQARTQLRKLSDRAVDLERQATIDSLTQIANRAAFEERLGAVVDDAQRSQRGVGLIMLDLDHFKRLNDAHGHPAGDEALRRVGRLLRKTSEGPQLAARYGGEEFAVIVAGATARTLRELAEDIRKNIEKLRFEHNGQMVSFTASLGAAHVSYEWEMASPKEIIERADECLYDAKRFGRNRVEITF